MYVASSFESNVIVWSNIVKIIVNELICNISAPDVAFGNISDRMSKIFEAIIAYVSYIIKVITRAIEVLPL